MEAYLLDKMTKVESNTQLKECMDDAASKFNTSFEEVQQFLFSQKHKWKVCVCITCTGIKHWGEICARCGNDLAPEQVKPKDDDNMILCYRCDEEMKVKFNK